MRSFALIGVCCLAVGNAAADSSEMPPQFAQCQTLASCFDALDAVATSRKFGAGSPVLDEQFANRLEEFGEPAKREIIKRATGSDKGWRELAGWLLMYWQSFDERDVPALIAALHADPGGGAARPLGLIGTPEALAALADDVRLHGTESQSGFALEKQGERGLRYLLPLLEVVDTHSNRGVRWEDVAKLIADMKTARDDLPRWVSTALDRNQSVPHRVSALRVISAIGSDAKNAAPKLRVLLNDPDVGDEAVAALTAMADESVVTFGDECRTGDAFWEDFDGALCLSRKAAYGSAARPIAPPIFEKFSTSLSGADRANAATFAAAVGYSQANARLIEMLDDPDWRAVYAAVRSLGWLGAKDAIPALERVARNHWLNSVRDEAKVVIGALNGPQQRLAPPIINPGRLDWPPSVEDFEIDAMKAPDVAPCPSVRWIWKGQSFVPPQARNAPPEFLTLALSDGHLEGIDHGEFGGELDWVPKSGAREVVYRANIDGLALAPGGVVAVSNAGGSWSEYQDPNVPRDMSAETAVTMVIDNGGGGSGYVIRAWRDVSGGWRVKEIARLPRAADAFVAIARGLYVAWSGNRAIMLTLDGVEGVATCTAK